MKLTNDSKPRDPGQYLTTGYVAKVCGVSVVAVKKWIRQGKLSAIRTPGGHFRIRVDEFERFRAEYRFDRPSKAPVRVLVVDDDPAIVALLRDTLEGDPGYEIDSASDGYEGLLKVGTFRPDILVLDLRMPGIDGFEVCRRVKSAPAIRGTRILAISGFATAAAGDKALRSGADQFLAKPFNLADLQAAVKRLAQDASA